MKFVVLIKAIILAAQSLRLGDAKIVLAGGMENMSLGTAFITTTLCSKKRASYFSRFII